MKSVETFNFTVAAPKLGIASLSPLVPLALWTTERKVTATGLLDTGSAVNVLPYRLGVDLGGDWKKEATIFRLTGNLARLEAKPLIVHAGVGAFKPVRLSFAWVKSDDVPMILGQTNFFMEFDVCFFRSKATFEIRPKTS